MNHQKEMQKLSSMMGAPMSKYYEVGYRKPPTYSRFRKGKSGNPTGRPKVKRLATVDMLFAEELQRPITIAEGGKKRKVTRIEALVKSTMNKALSGDPKLAKQVLEIASKMPPPQNEEYWITKIDANYRELVAQVERDAQSWLAEQPTEDSSAEERKHTVEEEDVPTEKL
jgi:hypothetical protein